MKAAVETSDRDVHVHFALLLKGKGMWEEGMWGCDSDPSSCSPTFYKQIYTTKLALHQQIYDEALHDGNTLQSYL